VSERAKGKGGLLVLVLGVLVVGGVVAAGTLMGGKPQDQGRSGRKKPGPVVNYHPPEFATIRFKATDMQVRKKLRLVADGEAADGQALEAPADHPLSQRPGGTHKHLCRHYPDSFDGYTLAEKKRFAALKKAVEHDRVFAFKEGTATATFKVEEEGDYSIYLHVKWCCACGNSFYFTVDDRRLEIFSENGGTYDLGGGTFDVSILDVGEGVFQVESTNGDTHLGGDDFDEVMIDYVAEEFRKEQGVDLRQQIDALQRLKEACERAKCELSTSAQTEINLPYITAVSNVPKHLTMKISRAKFESLVHNLIERTRGPVVQALKDAGLNPGDINEVVLVGGSTRIPAVQELVRKLFGREPHKGVNPDEVVAIGAAIQGAILGGEDLGQDIQLVDVTPLTLGVEVKGGLMAPLVERNTTIPTDKSEVFTTAEDNQPAVTVKVYQGERKMATENRLLGSFDLTGIPPALRGMPQIEVTFNIDANGILNVSAKDKGTGKEQSIRVESSSGLTEEDIERMVTDAEAHAEEDQKRAELVQARNQAEQMVFQTEQLLKEHGDKVPASDKEAIEKEIEKLKKVAEGQDKAAIDAQVQAVVQASHKISEAMYKASAEEAEKVSAAARESSEKDADPKGKQDVVDADFKVVDGDK